MVAIKLVISIGSIEPCTLGEINIVKRNHLIKIQNVIATADLKQSVDAIRFNQFSWGRYDLKNNYNGKVGYVKDEGMQGRATVFVSGKMISTGAKSVLQSVQQLEHTMDLLINGNFIKRKQLEPEVRNIVAMMDIGRKLDISQLSQTPLPP